MGNFAARTAFRIALLALVFHATPSFAQATVASPDPQLMDTAKKLYQALAEKNLDQVKALCEKSDSRKLTSEKLSFGSTGPKLNPAFDGKVDVLRQTDRNAVVSAMFFTPESAEIPKVEVSRVTIFFEKHHGQWQADAPDKKDAAFDGNLNGGWYHSGSFTFCPNTGFQFLGNHFSDKLNCRSSVPCER
jgi:hypothetical protein